MATSVSLAISRELTGRVWTGTITPQGKGQGGNHCLAGPSGGAIARSPAGRTHPGVPPPRPRAPRPSIANFHGAPALVQQPLRSNATAPGCRTPTGRGEGGVRGGFGELTLPVKKPLE